MFSNDRHDKKMLTALAAVEAAVSRISPAEKFDVDREDTVALVEDLLAQHQRSRKLTEHCDEAVAAIRASLEGDSGERG